MTFKELELDEGLLEGLEAMGFETATPIQEQAIPLIQQKKDLIACAQTGTGKTAAFILPVIDKIIKSGKNHLSTVVIVPTRELAIQIDQQIEGFSYFVPVTSCPIYGGGQSEVWDTQKKALKKGADIIIATPGRFKAHLGFGYADLSKVEHLILDEADRMLDMGFYDDIMSVIKRLPKNRQTLMFSATMPPKIRKLAREILNEPEEVSIAISKPSKNILQAAYLVYDDYKTNLIEHIVKGKEDKNAIIFASSKRNVDNVTRQLRRLKIRAKAIHSDLDQRQREDVLLDFKSGKVNILVATDVLARGIDIEGLDMVINYDVPGDAEDYVHRIGRTARASASGVAITLINDKDQHRFQRIEQLIEQEIKKLKPPIEVGEGPEYDPKKRRGGGGKRGGGFRRGGGNNRNNKNRGRNDDRRGGNSGNKKRNFNKDGKPNSGQSSNNKKRYNPNNRPPKGNKPPTKGGGDKK